MMLSKCVIEGKVLSEGSLKPLDKYRVSLRSRNLDFKYYAGDSGSRYISGENGEFKICYPMFGNYKLYVDAPNYKPAVIPVDVQDDNLLILNDIILEKAD